MVRNTPSMKPRHVDLMTQIAKALCAIGAAFLLASLAGGCR